MRMLQRRGSAGSLRKRLKVGELLREGDALRAGATEAGQGCITPRAHTGRGGVSICRGGSGSSSRLLWSRILASGETGRLFAGDTLLREALARTDLCGRLF